MSTNIPFRLPVDFGNCDSDGAVRLATQGAVAALASEDIQLREGLEVLLTDGEINAIGKVTIRTGMWVAVITEWLESSEEE